MDIATLGISVDSRDVRRSDRDLDRLSRSARDTETATGRMARNFQRSSNDMSQGFSNSAGALSVLKGAFVAAGFATFAREIFQVNAEFDRLNASLVTVTGSTAGAGKAFAQIQDFAKTTPFQLTEVTESFIKMQSLGLDPSENALKSYGNTASAMGKSLNQMVEAVADAATGEFERLKEFGIKARKQGDDVSFTFQGVTTTIGNNASEIEQYLQTIGNIQFAGGMDRQMATLGGAISNLTDQWAAFIRAIGDGGGESAIRAATESLGALTATLGLYDAYAKGQIGFWEFLTTGPEEAIELLRNTDLELKALERTLAELESDKLGDLYWSENDQAALQAAKEGLAGYRRGLELTAALQDKIAAHEMANMPPAPPVPDPKETAAALAKQLRLLQAANRKIYAEEIKAGKKLTDAWENTASDREAAEIRAINDLATLHQTEDEARQAQVVKDSNAIQDYWVVAAEGADAANERAKAYAETLAKTTGTLQGNTSAILEGLQVSQKAFDQESRGHAALQVAIQATNLVRAIGAVINQGTGDPYTAFARMAAMAGAMAALGQSVGGMGGGFTDTAADRQAEQGTGTVLGDPSAKSESLLRATEMTASAAEQLVGINTDMLTALHNLRAGIDGAVTMIARDAGTLDFSEGQASIDAMIADSTEKVRAIGDNVNRVLFGPLQDTVMLLDSAQLGINTFVPDLISGWLAGSSKVTDEGVQIVGGLFEDILDGATVQAYQTVQYKKYAWSSKKTKEFQQDLGPDASEQFTLIFQSLADTVSAGAIALGMSAADAEEAINSYNLDTLTISLKDLDPDAQRAELSAVFSGVFDNLAGDVVPFIEDMKIAGEGAGETLARLATSVQVTESVMSKLGLQMVSLGAEQFTELSVALVEAAGGVDSLIDSSNRFFEAYAPEELQFESLTSGLLQAMAGVGLSLPKTRDGLWDLMQSLDASTEAGGAQVLVLTSLTEMSTAYYDVVEEREAEKLSKAQESADAQRAIEEEAASAALEIAKRVADTHASLQEQYNQLTMTSSELRALERDTLDDSNKALFDSITALQEAAVAAARLEQAELDLAAKREQVASERYGLETRLLQLQGNTSQLRSRELLTLDQSNKSLQVQIWSLEDLAAASDNATKSAQSALNAELETYKERDAAAQKALSDAKSALQAAFTAEKALLSSTYQVVTDTLNASLNKAADAAAYLDDVFTDLSDTRKAMLRQADPLAYYENAQLQLGSVLKQARAGDFSQVSKLKFDTLSAPNTGDYATKLDYDRNFFRTLSAMTELESLTGAQLTTEERTVKGIEAQLEVAEQTYSDQIAYLEDQKNQYLALNSNVTSLAETIPVFETAQEEATDARKELERHTSLINAQLTALSGISSDVNSLEVSTKEYLSVVNNSVGNVNSGILSLTSAIVGSPTVEGSGSPGLAVDNSDLITELRDLKTVVNNANASLIINTSRTASQLRQWEFDGLPKTRTV